MSPYALARHATFGSQAPASAGDMGSPPSASTSSVRAAPMRAISSAGTLPSIVGVVSACVARDSARHAPRLCASLARGAMASVAPAASVAKTSPRHGSNVCDDARSTVESGVTPIVVFFP